MALQVESHGFSDVLVILGAAGVVIPAFNSLKLSPVVGFILVGMLVGPFGLGSMVAEYPWLNAVTITNRGVVAQAAEAGIVLLMFMIGLELSFGRLKTMRKLVFGLGGLQVGITSILFGVALWAGLGHPPFASLALGFALALSSTAIVLPMLSAEGALVGGAGRAAFACLLFQDLALIPALFLISAVTSDVALTPAGAGLAAAKGIGAILVLVVAGRWLLRPALRAAARTKSPEMFMAVSLLIVLSASAVTALAGLSLVVGALLAGLLIADTEYRRQVEVTVEPFKGLLLGVFLISTGMALDLGRIVGAPLLVAGGVVAVVLVKALVTAPLIRLFARGKPGWARTALLLGPSGEMTFIVLGAIAAAGLASREAVDTATIVTALAMTAIPLLSWLGRLLDAKAKRAAPPAEAVPEPGEARRVVIIGFGRVGRLVADMLSAHDIAYVAIDTDPDSVARERDAGRPVYYGDAASVDLLHGLGLDKALALVVTVDEPKVVARIAQAARAEHPALQIVARARDARHAAQLYRLGVSDAVPETIEASLQLSEAVLVDIGVPMGPVIASIHEKRAEMRARIQAEVPGLTMLPKLGGRRLSDA